MKRFQRCAAALLLAVAGPAAAGEDKPYVSARLLSMDAAQAVARAAAEACAKKGYQVSAAVVDRAGVLQAFVRHPLAGTHTVEVAAAKARASASFQVPSMMMAQEEFVPLRHAPGIMLLGGALPIRVGGHMYGAVGVSGAPGQKVLGDIDEECARAGVEAVTEALEFAE